MSTTSLTCMVVNGEYKVVQKGSEEGYPESWGVFLLRFLRDTGFAGMTDFITTIRKTTDPTDISYARDSLACEWCYIIDIDKGTFEVYKGYNKTPLDSSERFAFLQGEPIHGKYYPVYLIRSFDIFSLPDDLRFLAFTDPVQEDLFDDEEIDEEEWNDYEEYDEDIE